MNVIVWARVSSREQREGYSLDAQLRAARDRAQKSGWNIVREFVVAESAKRGAERLVFNEMLKWVKANAKRENIEAILSHKLDRICRNMRDAVRIQELEDSCGVQLAFVDNQFGPGAAGALSFNVMAAVAQYYSDNLRNEVIKGIDEKVRQGWMPGLAPFGYLNVPGDRENPIIPHPERAEIVRYIFRLYAQGNMSVKSIADRLIAEGHIYRPSEPRFPLKTISYILTNQVYLGYVMWRDKLYPGKHQPLIDRTLFQQCQDIIKGRNRRIGTSDLDLAGSLFRCTHCGQSISGEKITKKLSDGSFRQYIYYRCANNYPDSNHPRVRWREADLEQIIAAELGKLRIESDGMREIVRDTMSKAFTDIGEQKRRRAASLTKRQTELKSMQDRLLTAFLNGTIDESAFSTKSTGLKTELVEVEENLLQADRFDPSRTQSALAVFDWCQNASQNWLSSNKSVRREILDTVCLNRQLSDVSLCLEMRRPFRELAERPNSGNGQGNRI